MITKPSIDELIKLKNVNGNKYILCCALSKRAKELNVMQVNEELDPSVKTIGYAADELAEGKITVINEEF